MSRWTVLYGVYGILLVLYAIFIAVEGDASVRTRLYEGLAFVVLPAVLFVGGVLPLQRRSRSRVLLVVVAVSSVLVGVVLAAVSWGVALPLAFGLWAVAIGDLERALALGGIGATRRVVVFAALLVAAAAFVGLAAPIAGVVAVVGVVLLARALLSARRDRTALNR